MTSFTQPPLSTLSVSRHLHLKILGVRVAVHEFGDCQSYFQYVYICTNVYNYIITLLLVLFKFNLCVVVVREMESCLACTIPLSSTTAPILLEGVSVTPGHLVFACLPQRTGHGVFRMLGSVCS